jgi:hypothetical protein
LIVLEIVGMFSDQHRRDPLDEELPAFEGDCPAKVWMFFRAFDRFASVDESDVQVGRRFAFRLAAEVPTGVNVNKLISHWRLGQIS